MRRETPGRELRRAVDFGVHRLVNERLFNLHRSGYGTVTREGGIECLDSLIAEGQIDSRDLVAAMDKIVAQAVVEYVRGFDSERSWLFHSLRQANQTIDSLALHLFLKEQESDAITREREFLASLIDNIETEEVNE